MIVVEYKKRKCFDCGELFQPANSCQKYCGVDCNAMPKWFSEATNAQRNNFRSQGTIPLKFNPFSCDDCGGKFIATHPSQKNCGKNCKAMPSWWNAATEIEKRAFRSSSKQTPLRFQIRKCEVCFGSFIPCFANQHYCDIQCREEHLKENTYPRLKKRLKDSPVSRLVIRARKRIYDTLKKQYTSKHLKSFDLIGMTGKEFMEYLLSHDSCQADFTADNYGSVWHVDHIRPLASFNLADESQQKEAFHYSNCQPLSVEDNLKKSSFYEGERHRHVRKELGL